MKKRSSRALAFANVFGTLGYLSLVIQWGWSLLILSYPILSTRPDFLFPAQPATPPAPIATDAALSPFIFVIAVIVAVAVVIAAIVMLARLPQTIGKRGSDLTHIAAVSVVPMVTQHKKITKKERQRLSHDIVLVLKLLGIVLPVVLLCFAQPLEHIEPLVVWVVATFCGAWSLFYFILQQLIARLAKLNVTMIW